ncbi:Abi-alpha family protein [Mycobacterium talmoniae]|uniref:DUF4393 domain-containing protein n=1 Tax=Mycobacterium talmoniae TaxID=1858794 RepID=A0A1S1NGU8_9MYCO|nr:MULTISPECIES: Abi-alpha family protein [Mycobacterium]OHV03642.1 hypothetical protein BKN37_13840 [Mycobacterium talmoniae]PQM49556.1 hypothetical protein C1Y40_00207 [Mycobacterium talmoniae]TDH53128.1 DUF4393 domain-containing protein [Mycobacterium eburneum]
MYDPVSWLGPMADIARLGLSLANRAEEQMVMLLRDRLNAHPPAESAASPAAPPADSLNTKMSRLLDRALDQSTRGSQVELYHRLLDQLVADEARIVGALSDGSASPLVNVYAWARPRLPRQPVLENACLVGRTANVALPHLVPQYVGHLLHLGLVETGPEDPAMKADYEVLMAETMVLKAVKAASRGPLAASVEKLTLSLSHLGQSLWAAAMRPDAE